MNLSPKENETGNYTIASIQTAEYRFRVLAIFVLMLGLLLFMAFYTQLHYNACQSINYADEFDYMKEVYKHGTFSFLSVVAFLLIVFNSLLLYSTCTSTQTKTLSKNRDWHRRLELHMSFNVLCVSAFSLLEFASIAVIAAFPSLEHVYDGSFTFSSIMHFVFYITFGGEFRSQLLSLCKSSLYLASRPCQQGKEFTRKYVTRTNGVELEGVVRDLQTGRVEID